jgi:acetyl-CoA carboxylase carboxyltransferase component
MVSETSHMFITGPEVIKTVTGETVTQEELGGAMSHASKSGVAHFVTQDDEDCLEQIRYLLSFIPSNNFESPPYYPPTDDPSRDCDDLNELVPDSPNKPYDMHQVIASVFDDGEFFEVHAHWAMNILTGFARLNGRMTVITRKAYGGAYVVMNSKHIRADVSFAWPSAEIAVMGAEGAVNIIHRREISDADDPEEKRKELVDDYVERFSNPYIAAERGYVDAVIEPKETRRKLIASLEMLRSKRETIPQRKHGNVPL